MASTGKPNILTIGAGAVSGIGYNTLKMVDAMKRLGKVEELTLPRN